MDALFDSYGTQALPHVTVARDLHAFIQAAKGEEVFDAVELFVEHRKSSEFVSELNTVLGEEDVPWRMLAGEMVLLDAEFARDELAERANGALHAAGFEGAIRELRRAREHLIDGDERAAIHSAGSSFEGVLMALLRRDEGTAKRLLQELTREGYFNGLPVKLRERFVQSVMQALPWMRNSLGGHGQGAEAVEIPVSTLSWQRTWLPLSAVSSSRSSWSWKQGSLSTGKPFRFLLPILLTSLSSCPLE